MEVEKGSEFTNRGSIFKQMAEMKKKIQLVEGKKFKWKSKSTREEQYNFPIATFDNSIMFFSLQVNERQFSKIVNPKRRKTRTELKS